MASLHVEADVNWVVELSNQNELLGFQKSLVSRVGSNLCLTNRILICRVWNKYNGIQPAIKAQSKTKFGSRKNRGRGLICARASRAYTNLFVNSERSEHLK